jgi:hypothetical protein
MAPQQARASEQNKKEAQMPNYCSNKLTITGPNRQTVLTKLKGDKPYVEGSEEHIVYFEVNNILPRPDGLGERWADWGYEKWCCRNVYQDGQNYKALEDADVICFISPWDPPALAIAALAAMFPENTFLLESGGVDVPKGTTLYKGGKQIMSWAGPEVKSIA